MKRTASAVWKGGIKDGAGTLSTGSGALSEQKYSFGMRFEDEPGTNPEELIGAAHAGCFAMALSGFLQGSDITAERIDAEATVSLDKEGGGFAISGVHLAVRVQAPGADREAVEKAAETAKASCPVSKALNAEITMELEVAG